MKGQLVVLYRQSCVMETDDDINIMVRGPQRLSDIKNNIEVHRQAFEILSQEEIPQLCERCWAQFNHPRINPLLEKKAWIMEKHLHASMSLGDAIRLEISDGSSQTWAAQGMGWKQLVK